MAGFLSATGSELSFGRVNYAYTTNSPGSAGTAPSGGQNISLSSVLGANGSYGAPSVSPGTQISFSAHFGGRYFPYTY